MYGVAIASGKGGVGKSIVSSSIIQELASAGKTVGAIDADFSNSNLGRLLRINGDISITPEKRLIPVRQNGLSFFSMEQIAQDKGIAMTGEEYAEIIRDVLENGIWDVDYMVVDLPAVISNEFKSVLAYFEDNYLGTIIVAQPAHLTTTERVVKLHQINGVPIPGLVEDMVSFRCTHGGLSRGRGWSRASPCPCPPVSRSSSVSIPPCGTDSMLRGRGTGPRRASHR